jgi:hypothetical protein
MAKGIFRQDGWWFAQLIPKGLRKKIIIATHLRNPIEKPRYRIAQESFARAVKPQRNG